MKGNKNFFKLTEEDNGDVFWNGVQIKPRGENRIDINNLEFDITPDIQTYLTNTKLTTKFLDDIEKETVFEIIMNVGFYDNLPKVGLKAARMKDALYDLPKAIAKIRNPPLPTIENVSDSDLGQGVKIIIHLTLSIYTPDSKSYED